MNTPEKKKAKAIIVEIIRQAGGVFNNKTNLFKAFYLAHLEYAKHNPGYLSAWPIVRLPRGPGIHRFDGLLVELMAEDKVRVRQVQRRNGKLGFRFSLPEASRTPGSLPEGAVKAISCAVSQVKNKPADEVSDASHRISRSWRNAKNGEELNIYTDLLTDEEYASEKACLEELARGLKQAWQ
jgi:hypothetical protein